MPVTATCACGKSYPVPDEHAGKSARCRACGGTFMVPAPVSSPAAGPRSPRRNRSTTILAVAAAMLLVLNLGLIASVIFASRPKTSTAAPTAAPVPAPASTERIAAREFVLIDKAGAVAARLGFDPDWPDMSLPRLELYDQGVKRAAFQVQGQGWTSLALFGRDGKERAALAVHDSDGKGRLDGADDKRSTLRIVDRSEVAGFEVVVPGDDPAGIEAVLRDKDVKRYWVRKLDGESVGK